jgi:hypothetical protein
MTLILVSYIDKVKYKINFARMPGNDAGAGRYCKQTG